MTVLAILLTLQVFLNPPGRKEAGRRLQVPVLEGVAQVSGARQRPQKNETFPAEPRKAACPPTRGRDILKSQCNL
jgi:hypothetical protein